MKNLLNIFVLIIISSCSAPLLVTSSFDPTTYKFPMKTKSTVSIKRFETGRNISREMLVVEDGRSNISHYSTHSAYMITKNGRNYLIDTGLGINAREQFKEFPAYAKPLFDFEESKTVKEQVGEVKIDGIFFTHLHFDHASGAEDFGEVDLYTLKEEFDNMKSDDKMVFIKSQMDADYLRWNFINLKDSSYGPFKKSLDFFDDGSFIIVPLDGHTDGSVGYIINTEVGRFFMVGDAVWTFEQVVSRKDKGYFASLLVDGHAKKTKQEVELLHKIWMSNADLRIVPSHDLKANFVIPKF